jgi:hypothetical protein
MDGIDGEWITERGYLNNSKPPSGSKLSATDIDILRMADLEAVMVRVILFLILIGFIPCA